MPNSWPWGRIIITTSADIPKDEVQLRDSKGNVIAKIINIGGWTVSNEKHDAIKRPDWYYNFGKATQGPLDFADEQDLDVYQHAVVKYVTRAGRKPGSAAIKDYKQALFYLQRKIELLQEAAVDELAPGPFGKCIKCGADLSTAAGSFQGVCDDCIREQADITPSRRIGPADRRKCNDLDEAARQDYRRVSDTGRRETDKTPYDDLPTCEE